MEEHNYVEVTRLDDFVFLTFNRPDQLNAMNRAMMNELVAALEMITGDERIRVAIITGKGRAFMAGADIKEYALQTPEAFKDFRQKGMRLYELIEKSGIPFIAAINGPALGGGFEIALSCDFIVAADTAVMGLPEVHLGLIPGGGGTYRLLQKLGLNRVREVVLLGQSYLAAEMNHWGVVHKVTTADALMEEVLQLAEKLKRRPAQSLRTLKRMLTPEAMGQPFPEQMAGEGESVFELFQTPEAKRLINTFVKKNKQ
jgi:enoyl-CoA hydratase/carnithine racemase